MKHTLCWSDEGDLIIDVAFGSGTMAVRKRKQCLFVYIYIYGNMYTEKK